MLELILVWLKAKLRSSQIVHYKIAKKQYSKPTAQNELSILFTLEKKLKLSAL